jgi:sodium-dependent phosphate cotransporter
LFDQITNPIAGLMIGILATVLVQSSSTSTSIIVSLVGAGAMSIEVAIPVVMGANIGTSVTNTLVAMGQANDSDQFEKAFAGATVHDMFNFLAVMVLLPIEVVTGMLKHLTGAIMPADLGPKGDKWVGPIKIIVGPVVKLFLDVDSKVVEKVAAGSTTCADIYAKILTGNGPCGEGKATGIIKCACNSDGSIKYCPTFFTDHATADDEMAAGGVALFISLVLLCVCLGVLVRILQHMVMGTSATMLRKATDVNGYLAMLIGCGITILVQSSSITTSVLTPLVGVGVLPLSKMYPLSLGANIGTTFTAILASLVSSKPAAVQIALCHLFFNLIGILIWYPIPFMRNVPLKAARGLGTLTRRYKSFPLIYIGFSFVLGPLMLLGISSLYENGGPLMFLGILITVALVVSILYFIFWWLRRDGQAKIYAKLDRQQLHANTLKDLPQTIQAMQAEIDALKKSANGIGMEGVTPKLLA